MNTVLHILEDAARTMRAAGSFVSAVHISSCYGRSRGIMKITWSIGHRFERMKNQAAEGVHCSALGRPADLLLRLPELSDQALDLQASEAAWRLGAWDLMRFEKPPLPDGADIHDVRYGLSIFFGRSTYVLPGIGNMAEGGGASDAELQRAAREGWLEWMFKPLALADDLMRRSWAPKDCTLDENCRRAAITLPHHPFDGAGRGLEWRLGESSKRK